MFRQSRHNAADTVGLSARWRGIWGKLERSMTISVVTGVPRYYFSIPNYVHVPPAIESRPILFGWISIPGGTSPDTPGGVRRGSSPEYAELV